MEMKRGEEVKVLVRRDGVREKRGGRVGGGDLAFGNKRKIFKTTRKRPRTPRGDGGFSSGAIKKGKGIYG